MDIVFVNKVGAASTDSNAVTTGPIDMTGANFLVAVTTIFNTTAVDKMSDSQSNTWTGLTIYSVVSGLIKFQILYAKNASVSSSQTFTLGAAVTYPALEVYGFSGVDTTAPADVENGASEQAGPDTHQPGSITPSASNALIIIGYTGTDTGAAPTIDSGYTSPMEFFQWSAGATDSVSGSYLIHTSGAINPTASKVGSGTVAIGTAAFLAATGGAAATLRQWRMGSLGVQ